MKYFTKESFTDEFESAHTSYQTYIDEVFLKLPHVLKILSQINLHDGKILKVDDREGNITITGKFGDLEVGYFELTIKYFGAEILGKLHNGMVILRDEIEKCEGHFSHRMIFTSKTEVEIQFQDIEITARTASP